MALRGIVTPNYVDKLLTNKHTEKTLFVIPAQSIRADGSLASLYVLTNIVMNEFENIVIQKLLGSGVINFTLRT